MALFAPNTIFGDQSEFCYKKYILFFVNEKNFIFSDIFSCKFYPYICRIYCRKLNRGYNDLEHGDHLGRTRETQTNTGRLSLRKIHAKGKMGVWEICNSYAIDMRICSQDCTKTSLNSLKLALILLTIWYHY